MDCPAETFDVRNTQTMTHLLSGLVQGSLPVIVLQISFRSMAEPTSMRSSQLLAGMASCTLFNATARYSKGHLGSQFIHDVKMTHVGCTVQ